MTGIYWMGKFVPLYGAMIALGVLAAGFVGYWLSKRNNLSGDWFLLFYAYALGGGLAGAKLLYIIVNFGKIEWSRLLRSDNLMQIIQGGFVFYGGTIGGLLALLLAGAFHKQPVLTYMEVAIPCVPIAHAFGRIGCHFASCCYGIPYDGPFHIIYHAPAYAPAETPLFPVQMLEAGLNVTLSFVLIAYVVKKGCTINSIAIYGISYGVVRFFLEYLRYDMEERGGFMMFSTSQWISILIILAMLVIRPVIARQEKGHLMESVAGQAWLEK